uniref:ATBET12 n=1 Tax=Solanum tuberosum TaxID=4113 RepID=M1B1M0_SOLTU
MADIKQASTFSGDQQRPSRLQWRAPASIQINCATDWNVGIPLLSPLISSPKSSNLTAADEFSF